MQLVADIKCYHCGHTSGELIGTRMLPVKEWTFEPSDGGPAQTGGKIRCLRCKGPVYMEDVRPFIADDPARAIRRHMAALRGAA